jgi:hypothetical protein
VEQIKKGVKPKEFLDIKLVVCEPAQCKIDQNWALINGST